MTHKQTILEQPKAWFRHGSESSLESLSPSTPFTFFTPDLKPATTLRPKPHFHYYSTRKQIYLEKLWE